VVVGDSKSVPMTFSMSARLANGHSSNGSASPGG